MTAFFSIPQRFVRVSQIEQGIPWEEHFRQTYPALTWRLFSYEAKYGIPRAHTYSKQKIINMNYIACIPKNCGHYLSGRLYVFAFFGAGLPGEVQPFDSSRMWSNVSSTVMNWRRNSFALHWNISKHCFEIVTRSHLGSTVSKCGTHLADSFFVANRSKLKSLCHVMCLWPQQARALSFIDQSKQYRGFYRWFLT